MLLMAETELEMAGFWLTTDASVAQMVWPNIQF